MIVRDPDGLINGIKYVIDSDGLIDWRKMIRPEYLVPNKKLFEKNGLSIPETTENLKDNEVLILLAGIKKLAKLRGYSKILYSTVVPNENYVVVTCQIEWLPNFETEGRVIVSSGIGDAHPQNTDGFGKIYLATIAENRAFVRCVRNFLGINIIGQDEICQKDEEEGEKKEETVDPLSLLKKLMVKKNVSFEEIKEKLIEEGSTEYGRIAKNLQSINDIPKLKALELISRLKKKKS